MVKRIVVLVVFLVIPPFLVSLVYRLLTGGSPDLSYWVSSLLPSIGAWTAFCGTIAEITGYSLRDFAAGRGKWQSQSIRFFQVNEKEVSNMQVESEKALKRKKELLEATEKRVHALRMKKKEFGPAALSAGEAAELREAEEEVRQLGEEILHLRAQDQVHNHADS